MLDAGLGVAAVRYIVKYREESEKLASAMGVFILFNVVLGVIALGIMMGIAFNAETIFAKSMSGDEINSVRIIILITGFYLFLSFVLATFQAAVTAYEKFVFIKVVDIIRSILTPLLIIPFLLTGHKAITMSIIILVSFTSVLVVKTVYCFVKLRITVSFKNIDYSLIKEAIPFSAIVFLKLILDRLYWTEGQMILGYTTGTVAVAIIALSLQMKGYFEAIAQSVNNLFLPRCSEYAKLPNGISLTSELFVRVCRIQTILLGLVISGYVVFGREFMNLWAGTEYDMSFTASLLFMIPCTIPLIQGMGNSILQAFGIVKFQTIVYLGIVIFVAALSFVLGDKFGAIGCAAAIGGAVVIFEIIIMNVYYDKIGLDIRQFWRNFIRIMIPYVLIAGLWFYFIPKELYSGWLRLGISILVFSVVSFTVEYLCVFNMEEKELCNSTVKRLIRLNK